MSLWDKLNTELNRAGRAAQGAFGEGRLRIEIFRVRQLADKSAQALGYAVYSARAAGGELDAATWDRLAATLREHEAEASRLEHELAEQSGAAGSATPAPDSTPAPEAAPPAAPPAAADAAVPPAEPTPGG